MAVGDTSLQGEDLAQFAPLRRIGYLEANEQSGMPVVLVKLRDDAVLELLSVKYCHLTDEDMKNIASLPRLYFLSIDGNAITAEGIRTLTRLRQLQTLSICDNKVGPDVIPLLAAFTDLKHLHIDAVDWPADAQLRLRAALPQNCLLEIARH